MQSQQKYYCQWKTYVGCIFSSPTWFLCKYTVDWVVLDTEPACKPLKTTQLVRGKKQTQAAKTQTSQCGFSTFIKHHCLMIVMRVELNKTILLALKSAWDNNCVHCHRNKNKFLHFLASASLQMQKDEETVSQRMNNNNSNRYS